MRAVLMNQNIPVLELEIHDGSGRIKEIVKELNPEYMPLIALYQKDKESALQDWMRSRCIPDTRAGLEDLLKQAGVDTTALFSIKNLGLNLTDQYWFKLESMDLKWDEINLFEHDFLSNHAPRSKKNCDVNYSPDASSNGELPKRWVIKEQERYLLKEGTAPYFQQPYNECVASAILDVLEIPHVQYTLEKIEEKMYSSCKTFITKDTEYIPALHIKDCRKRLHRENAYQHFMQCIEKLNIPCDRKDIDRILAFDFIIANNDRHYGNFGFIRDVKTLKFQGIAPVFDHGNSLWYRELTSQIKFSMQESKPFYDTHERQIEKIASIDFDLNRLTEERIDQICKEIFSENPYMDVERSRRISAGILAHCRHLERKVKF